MAKKIIGSLKLQVKAGQANPSPPVGPALGQRGLNIMMFVKEFNAKTADLPLGSPTPVVITYYQDKSFSLEFKTTPASFLLKQAAGLPQERHRVCAQGGTARPVKRTTQLKILGSPDCLNEHLAHAPGGTGDSNAVR